MKAPNIWQIVLIVAPILGIGGAIWHSHREDWHVIDFDKGVYTLRHDGRTYRAACFDDGGDPIGDLFKLPPNKKNCHLLFDAIGGALAPLPPWDEYAANRMIPDTQVNSSGLFIFACAGSSPCEVYEITSEGAR